MHGQTHIKIYMSTFRATLYSPSNLFRLLTATF